MTGLLVGQAPARSGGRPWESDAGTRLARYAGTDRDTLLAAFDACNLNRSLAGTLGKYDAFDLDEARAEAARLARDVLPGYPVALLCGARVSAAFGLPPVGEHRLGATAVYTLPHPAGTNMWWNSEENRLLGSMVATEALLHAGAGYNGRAQTAPRRQKETDMTTTATDPVRAAAARLAEAHRTDRSREPDPARVADARNGLLAARLERAVAASLDPSEPGYEPLRREDRERLAAMLLA